MSSTSEAREGRVVTWMAARGRETLTLCERHSAAYERGEIPQRHTERGEALCQVKHGLHNSSTPCAVCADEPASFADSLDVDDMVSAGRVAADYDYGRVLEIDRVRGRALVGWKAAGQALEVPIDTLRPVDERELLEAREAWAAERNA